MIELGRKIIHPIKWHIALFILCTNIVTVQPPWAVSNALKRPVVTTFSILGDMVEQVGGDTINVDSMEVE